jgi:hypothetical protein
MNGSYPLMLRTVVLDPPVKGYRRLAIEVAEDGVYLLMSRKDGDGPYEFDTLCESVADAEEDAKEGFGVAGHQWQQAGGRG